MLPPITRAAHAQTRARVIAELARMWAVHIEDAAQLCANFASMLRANANVESRAP